MLLRSQSPPCTMGWWWKKEERAWEPQEKEAKLYTLAMFGLQTTRSRSRLGHAETFVERRQTKPNGMCYITRGLLFGRPQVSFPSSTTVLRWWRRDFEVFATGAYWGAGGDGRRCGGRGFELRFKTTECESNPFPTVLTEIYQFCTVL